MWQYVAYSALCSALHAQNKCKNDQFLYVTSLRTRCRSVQCVCFQSRLMVDNLKSLKQ